MISLHYEKIEMKWNGENFYRGLSFYWASVKNCTVSFCFRPYKSLESGQKNSKEYELK